MATFWEKVQQLILPQQRAYIKLRGDLITLLNLSTSLSNDEIVNAVKKATGIELPTNRVEVFRNKILDGYGFTNSAKKLLASFPLTISNLDEPVGGGLTYDDRIELNGISHEAALHEFCHWWWERNYINKNNIYNFTKDWFRCQYAIEATTATRQFVSLQLFGDGKDWKGIFYNNNLGRHLTMDEITVDNIKSLIDWDHIFVNVCSFTMGSYKSGARALPEFMWKYFDRVFTGDITLLPYYLPGGNV